MTRRRTLLVRDPPPVVIEIREPSAHALSFAPVESIDDPARREALLAASGVDLAQRRWTRFLRYATAALGLYVVVRLLTGCAALEAAAPGLAVAHDVARAGCAILAASDGSSASVLAANQAMQRQVLDAQAQAAIERGANKAEIEALQASVVVLSAAVRASAEQIVRAAGNGPAKLAPCPADPPAEPKP